MTTNTEHLIAACAKLIACGPNPERLDDVEACITLVRLEMHDAGELHMHLYADETRTDTEHRFVCECGATKTAPRNSRL